MIWLYISCAVLCALVCGFLFAAPAIRRPMALSLATGGLAIALYTFMGAPEISSAPAAFEESGPRAILRARQAAELQALQALKDNPQDTKILLQLTGLQIQNGRIDRAIATLGTALSILPENDPDRATLETILERLKNQKSSR